MPLNPPALAAGFLAPNLLSVAHIGPGMPKFAIAVATGVTLYVSGALKVVTTGAGVLGVGVSILPLPVPPLLLIGALFGGFQSQSLNGPMSPLTITGLANGLSQGFLALALIQATWPTIGVGAGVAKFVGPSGVPSMIAGFASQGMVTGGSIKMATAIGIALDTVFKSLIIPVPIVGTPSIVPSGGAGSGAIL